MLLTGLHIIPVGSIITVCGKLSIPGSLEPLILPGKYHTTCASGFSYILKHCNQEIALFLVSMTSLIPSRNRIHMSYTSAGWQAELRNNHWHTMVIHQLLQIRQICIYLAIFILVRHVWLLREHEVRIIWIYMIAGKYSRWEFLLRL